MVFRERGIMEKKNAISIKNIIIGLLIGVLIVYGLSSVEIKDEQTIKLICASVAFLMALLLLFLTWKIDVTSNFVCNYLKQFKTPVKDTFNWLDENGKLKPKIKLIARIHYLIGCLLAISMGIACLFILK